MKSISPEVVNLYAELQRHTIADCLRYCNIHTCCKPAYCERARTFAAEHGVTLQDTGHPTLPFMTETGCIVPPHLRPECTEYSCAIRDHRGRPGDPKWTERYYELRRIILIRQVQEKKNAR